MADLPTFVAAGTGAAGTGAVTPGIPAGGQLGDIMILVIEGEGEDTSADGAPDSDWTAIGVGSVASATDGAADRTRLSAYWTPWATTTSRAVPDAGNHTIARIYLFRGVDLSDPFNSKTGSGSSATNGTSHTAATGFSTTFDNSLVCVAYGHGDDALSSPGSPANTSLTSVADAGEFASSQGSDGTVGLIYGSKVTAGAGGSFTWTTAASEELAFITFALNPLGADPSFQQDFEGGSDGTAMTTGNTGGNDQNPFALLYTPGAAVAEFDSAVSAHGSLSGLFSVASGENAIAWWHQASVTERYYRFYFRTSDATPTNHTTILRFENGGSFVGEVQLRTGGTIALRDSAFTLRYQTSNTVAADTLYRIEVHYVFNATTGHMEARLFDDIDSTTALEEIGNLTDNWNTGAAETDSGWGICSNPGQALSVWLDDLATDPDDWIGPVAGGTPATVTPATVAAVVAVPTPNALAESTVTPATVAAVGSVPTPTTAAEVTVTPATVAAVGAVPAPGALAGSTVTPATVDAVGDVPNPVVLSAVVVEPGTVVAVVAVPTPTVTVGGTVVTPGTVAVAIGVPTPALLAGATVTPLTVALVGAVPDPTISVVQAQTVTPLVVGLTVAIPTPSVKVPGTVTPATVAGVFTVPTPTYVSPVTVSPVTVAAILNVLAPLIGVGALPITAPSVGQFYRLGGNLVVAPIGRSTRIGFKSSEGWEQVSDKFRYDEQDDSRGSVAAAMLAVAGAWAAESGSSAATLKTAINAALKFAGFRAPDGSSLS